MPAAAPQRAVARTGGGVGTATRLGAGNLHRYLRRCPGLRYSEFGSQQAGVPHEDLMQLL